MSALFSEDCAMIALLSFFLSSALLSFVLLTLSLQVPWRLMLEQRVVNTTFIIQVVWVYIKRKRTNPKKALEIFSHTTVPSTQIYSPWVSWTLKTLFGVVLAQYAKTLLTRPFFLLTWIALNMFKMIYFFKRLSWHFKNNKKMRQSVLEILQFFTECPNTISSE